MDSHHYLVKWNCHQSSVMEMYYSLLQDENMADVTLACSEGSTIKAHKMVLSACSSYFQSLFMKHPERHPIVILKDVNFAGLKAILEFMYKGEVNILSSELTDLLNTATLLKVRGLSDMINLNTQAVDSVPVAPFSSNIPLQGCEDKEEEVVEITKEKSDDSINLDADNDCNDVDRNANDSNSAGEVGTMAAASVAVAETTEHAAGSLLPVPPTILAPFLTLPRPHVQLNDRMFNSSGNGVVSGIVGDNGGYRGASLNAEPHSTDLSERNDLLLLPHNPNNQLAHSFNGSGNGVVSGIVGDSGGCNNTSSNAASHSTDLSVQNNRKFTCEICGNVFKTKEILESHLQRPYQCDICSKKFCHYVIFKRHKNRHLKNDI